MPAFRQLAAALIVTAALAHSQEPLPTGPVRVSGGVMAGALVNKVTPPYPPEARDAHVSGSVVMSAIVGKDGHIRDLSVISGPDMLRQGALDAVQQWVYRPYLLQGVPTEVATTITVNFNFGGPPPPPVSVPPVSTDGTGVQAGESLGPLVTGADHKPYGPMRIAGGVMAGSLLTKVNPVYPQEAKDQQISGSVVLHAIIGKDGMIENLTVISGPTIFRASALDAVRQWTYRPFTLNGSPTEVDTTITVNYSLSN